MAYNCKADQGSLWRLDSNLICKEILNKITISNGLAWNEDENILFFVDSMKYSIDCLQLDNTGEIVNSLGAKIIIPQEWGMVADGMTIDNQGMLWVAMYGGSTVIRWNPNNGEMIGRVTQLIIHLSPHKEESKRGVEQLDGVSG